jgi:uncharacterized protein YjbI with pentapeptide repeats
MLQQRGSAAFHQVWGAAAPIGSKGLRTIQDASKKAFDRLHATPWRVLALQYRPLLVGFLGLLLLLAIWKVPQWQGARWEGRIEAKEVAKQESDTRTTVVQVIGGAVLFIGLYFTAKTLHTTQEGQITDRFTKAINQLGEAGREKLAMRLGGIYALERIARDSERDHWPIMEILTAYVRENAPWKEGKQRSQEDIVPSKTQPMQSNQSLPKLATDIQAILTVLGRRTRTYGKGEVQQLDLGNTNLRGAWLLGAHLEGAFLAGVHLEGANLPRAHLDGANLPRAHLEGAFPWQAHLEGAIMAEAHLEGARLGGAHLEGAFLVGAHMERADLGGAELKRAILYETHLEGAYLPGAHLEGANLRAAYLEGADLAEAHLEGAILWQARLREAKSLTVEQLSAVKTLHNAHLDPPLQEQIQQQYPHLLEEY